MSGDKHKGLKEQNRESALKVFSEGDKTIQFLVHKDDCLWSAEWPVGCRLWGGKAWEALADEAVMALVCGSWFRSWFRGCRDGGTQLDLVHYY